MTEPVLWLMPDGKIVDKWGLQFYGGVEGEPLYKHPPKRGWIDLTEEEIDGICLGDEAKVRSALQLVKEKNT